MDGYCRVNVIPRTSAYARNAFQPTIEVTPGAGRLLRAYLIPVKTTAEVPDEAHTPFAAVSVYPTNAGQVSAEFVEGVLIRYTITSN